jgi:hypothetical protein
VSSLSTRAFEIHGCVQASSSSEANRSTLGGGGRCRTEGEKEGEKEGDTSSERGREKEIERDGESWRERDGKRWEEM